ncbi:MULTISPECIES: SRPBCC family protein [unclassified Streptomyces]|uniref:SRPBCC family protein n=1 Tax=unclassified Streptomyces TaxID=2593676 RepID=UPI0036E51151
MTCRSTISITTEAAPEQAYSCLRDPRRYGDWLPRSASYRGTTPGRTTPAAIGDTYVDHTPLGKVRGTVTDASPGRLAAFRQATDDDALVIDIVYRVEPAAGGCTVTRTGRIAVAGRLRPVGPLVTAMVRRENRRTMARLKEHLDRSAPR